MKKFIAVILVLVLLFSIACINVFATTNSQKLSGELFTMISNSKDDDVLPVCVFFHNYKTLVDMKSYPDHDKSIEEMKLYIKDCEPLGNKLPSFLLRRALHSSV